MEQVAHGCAVGSFELYCSLVSPEYLEGLRRKFAWDGGWGLFSPSLTVWLMIRSRLLKGASLERTWQECTQEEILALSPHSVRSVSGVLSANPTGLSYARQALPLGIAEFAADRLFEEACSLLPPASMPTYLIDGSTLRLESSSSLLKAYPPVNNQHGDSHWPMLRILVAHDARTGLAVRPEWGPLNGAHAVSEHSLLPELRARLPDECRILADRNFGVFQVAWLLKRNMLLRLTDVRAKALLGKGKSLGLDWDEQVTWRPSARDLGANPNLPKEALVHGRVVVRHVQGPKGLVNVCYFTDDLSSSAQEIVDRYPLRWNIETDLRSLKRVVGMEILRAKSPDVLAKEIILAIAAFNLIRTLMALAAERAGIDPRRIGFVRACNSVEIFARRGIRSKADYERMLDDIAARPLPDRRGRKPPPRTVWPKSKPYPTTKQAETSYIS